MWEKLFSFENLFLSYKKHQKAVDLARTLPRLKYPWKRIWSSCGMICFREAMSTVN